MTAEVWFFAILCFLKQNAYFNLADQTHGETSSELSEVAADSTVAGLVKY